MKKEKAVGPRPLCTCLPLTTGPPFTDWFGSLRGTENWLRGGRHGDREAAGLALFGFLLAPPSPFLHVPTSLSFFCLPVPRSRGPSPLLSHASCHPDRCSGLGTREDERSSVRAAGLGCASLRRPTGARGSFAGSSPARKPLRGRPELESSGASFGSKTKNLHGFLAGRKETELGPGCHSCTSAGRAAPPPPPQGSLTGRTRPSITCPNVPSRLVSYEPRPGPRPPLQGP